MSSVNASVDVACSIKLHRLKHFLDGIFLPLTDLKNLNKKQVLKGSYVHVYESLVKATASLRFDDVLDRNSAMNNIFHESFGVL